MYSSPTILLTEDNPRLSTKAAIKRATKASQAKLINFDIETIHALRVAYESARSDIRQQILSAGSEIKLEQLNNLLAQVNNRLSQLAAAQNRMAEDRLLAAAQIGTEPFGLAVAGSAAQIADNSAKFVINLVAEDGLQLSDRLWRINNHAKEIVGREITQAVIQGASASQAAQEFIQRGEDIPFSIRQKMKNAASETIANAAGKKLMTGEGNPYNNALRVFRTEIGRAHSAAFEESSFQHPDVVGTRFLLSPGHPRPDICDMHANVNRYGLGPGVYPKGKNPYPAHPNTLSFTVAVFNDEVDRVDKDSQEDRITWLNRQSGTTQEQVLGSRKKRAALEAKLLTEGQIATPWKVLKERYRRKGIDIDSLQAKPVPLDLASLRDDHISTGDPVSKAFKGKPFPAVQERVMTIIDSVHGDGNLPVIPILRIPASNRNLGTYYASNKPKIEIRSDNKHKHLTYVHEIGHFLDHKGIPSRHMSSTHDPLFDEWKKAVASSRAVNSLLDLVDGPDYVANYPIPKSYVANYLLTTEELWARSYAQYIATRSGDTVLISQVKKIMDAEKRSPIPLMKQWDEDDFESIADAIDKMFIQLGWIKQR